MRSDRRLILTAMKGIDQSANDSSGSFLKCILLGSFFLVLSFDGLAVDVDSSTLTGKIMCGYQGWFNCNEDGADLGWTHWAGNRSEVPGPGNVTVDLWPDLSEYGSDERYATEFRYADGSSAEVFSSHNKQTVVRHFEWMRDYGIDGAFVQRFANGLRSSSLRSHKDAVLSHSREGARKAGRVYTVMYDLSGLRKGETKAVKEDWKRLRTEVGVTEDIAYL
jgi:hypothetical protein